MKEFKKNPLVLVALSLFCTVSFSQETRVKGQMIVHQPTTATASGLQMNADLSASSLATVQEVPQKGKADEVVSKPLIALTPATDSQSPPPPISSPVAQPTTTSPPQMPGASVDKKPSGQSSSNRPSVQQRATGATGTGTISSASPPPPLPARSPVALQTVLPGIGVLPGHVPSKAQTIRIQENVTEEVPVSSLFPNRIATPFPNPKVIDSSDSAIKQDGSNIFISTSSKDPLAIFITSDRSGDPVISLLLKPAPIPPQNVVLQLDARIKPSGSAQAQEQIPDTYTGAIVHILKQIALGQVPAGMSGGPLPVSVGQMGDLLLATESRYSGRSMDVFTYWIENKSDRPIVLDESYFYTSQTIRAVSFYPISQLQPKEGTRLMIVSETAEGIGRE